MSLYLDLTEFLTNPITTGIQRIAGEMCRFLPHVNVSPVRLCGDRYVVYPPSLIRAIGNYFRAGSNSGVAEVHRLSGRNYGSPAKISRDDTILVPEAFVDRKRLEFFRELSDEQLECYRFIVFDLLPITHPGYFIPQASLAFHAYFQLLRRSHSCGFISAYTRDAYLRRLKRTNSPEGVVLRLGCDSLGKRPDQLILDRPLHFTVLGTIEPRKNHELILEAFEPLLEHIGDLELSFIGKMGWVRPQFAEKVRSLAANENSRFHFHSAPDDQTIRTHIERSRATIYVSAAEGYGLPPVESLWLGTPVIASRMVPSLQDLGTSGIHFVEPLTVDNLRRAVLALVNDAYAAYKTKETMSLNLPTWRSFTHDVLDWCGR